MPLVQDQSLDLLTSSPARHHCSLDIPLLAHNGNSQQNIEDVLLTTDLSREETNLIVLHRYFQAVRTVRRQACLRGRKHTVTNITAHSM